MLAGGGEIAAQGAETDCALQGTKATGDFLPDLHHAQVTFRQVVVEGDSKVHEFALPRLEMNSTETAAFLRDLFACYCNQPLLLLWDRASWHRGQAVAEVLAAHANVETVFFPPASPQLNPQEHVWSLARAHVSHNHTLPHLSTLRDAFFNYLGGTLFHFTWLETYAPSILFCHL